MIAGVGARADLRLHGAFAMTLAGARYLFTNFEPFDARRVFPCIDEPAAKVPWQLTLDVPAGLVAASNSPIVRTTAAAPGRTRVEFARTPPLPSYLVAFAVGPFEIVEGGVSAAGIPVRLLSPRGHAAAVHWAATTLAPLLDIAEDWLAVPYAYGKLDVVAVPLIGTGWIAMENPGLITAAEELMIDGRGGARRDWLEVLSHELAHQWFGDLVTPAAWSDVWLNEGLAAWLAPRLADAFALGPPARLAPGPAAGLVPRAPPREPAWRFVPPPPRVRPTPVEARDETTLRPYFDGELGAAALTPLEAHLGEGTVRFALQRYLHHHAHSTVTTDDLAEALTATTGRPWAGALASLLDQPGPARLRFALRCGADGARVEVTQVEEPVRTVPICVAAGDARSTTVERCDLLTTRALVVPLGPRCPTWLVPAARAPLHTVDVAPVALRGWLDAGWPVMPGEARRTLIRTLAPASPTAEVLALATRLLASAHAADLALAAELLAPRLRFLPEELGPALRAQLAPLRGHPALVRPLATLATGPALADTGALREVIAERDGAMDAEDAIAQLPGASVLPAELQLPLLRAAARRAPAQIAALVTNPDRTLRVAAQRALARALPTRALLAGFPSSLARLAPDELSSMLGERCGTDATDAVAAFTAAQLSPRAGTVVRTAYASCRDRATDLAPVFRAWLAPDAP